MSEQLTVYPGSPVPFWRDPALRYERMQVVRQADGAMYAAPFQALTPDGPWTECRLATVQDIQDNFNFYSPNKDTP